MERSRFPAARKRARKLYTQQPLNITGGSLTINYIPGSGGKWDLPSEFNAPVTTSASTSYSAHTTQVDGGGGRFNINGGTVNFRSINLASHASNPGKVVIGGDVTFSPSTLGGTGTAVIRSTGSLAQAGTVDLGAVDHTIQVLDGAPLIDVSIEATVTGTSGFTKFGAGAMQLAGTNTYSGSTTLAGGTLLVTKESNLGATPGSFQSANIRLDSGTLKTGSEVTSVSLTNAGSGYTSFPTVNISGAGADGVTPTANAVGKITSIHVTAGGSSYTGTAAVQIIGGGGTGATATATMSGGAVTAINITNQGSGYTSVPTVYITDGSGQGVTGTGAAAAVNGVAITGITLNSKGFDYASPTVSLTGGGGSGATASAIASTNLSLSSNRGITIEDSVGGTLHQTAGTTLTVSGVISSTSFGILKKAGPGTLVLTGANTYAGATNITGGKLSLVGATATLGMDNVAVQGTTAGTSLDIQSGVANAINDNRSLELWGGGSAGVADQGYANLAAGISEIVKTLYLSGAPQPAGTYGSSASGAAHQSDEYFSGTGMINVVSLAGDYNVDGVVDSADYVLWRATVGQPAGTLPNDNTGLTIGDDQYNLWRINFGSVASGSGSALGADAVPEPSTLALLTLGVAAFATRRKRQISKHNHRGITDRRVLPCEF